MDLLSSIRKEGSRGGVDFKWEDVTTSQHRENYLGHSLMAPVGRWQKNKDLSWYAKADSTSTLKDKDGNVIEESAEQRKARERKEEIKRIKEAEEDALARALGLPVVERNGPGSGANAIDVKEMSKVIKDTEAEAGNDEIDEVGRGPKFGDFVGKAGGKDVERAEGEGIDRETGGLVGRAGRTERSVRARDNDGKARSDRRSERNGSRERRHRHHHHHHRDRSREREGRGERHRRPDDGERPRERKRSRSPERRERRQRSRSGDRHRRIRAERRPERDSWRRSPEARSRRSRSPDPRERNRDRDRERWIDGERR